MPSIKHTIYPSITAEKTHVNWSFAITHLHKKVLSRIYMLIVRAYKIISVVTCNVYVIIFNITLLLQHNPTLTTLPLLNSRRKNLRYPWESRRVCYVTHESKMSYPKMAFFQRSITRKRCHEKIRKKNCG